MSDVIDEFIVVQGWIIIAISVFNYISLSTGIAKILSFRFGYLLEKKYFRIMAYCLNTTLLIIGILLVSTQFIPNFTLQ